MCRQWVLIAACSLITAAFLCDRARAQAPATQPSGEAVIPIREVVLFSSGVGYFEHFGSVRDNGAAELRFKSLQINDVLKSLVLQDMDGGHVGTVSYASQAPLAHRLRSFQVDITNDPSMADLLRQLRGARATLNVTTSNAPISGTILGVETRKIPATDKSPATEISVLNLKSGKVLESIRMDEIRGVELEDARLQSELDDALSAVAQARDQDKKPVTINFAGQGERRVRIGYVVETPVWKTSYRLILSKDKTPAKLQGWAIVENQTDNDWKDVQLSLVSGRPISFIQDLYNSQYIPRPVVQPPTIATLEPQTYAGGITREELEKLQEARAKEAGGINYAFLMGGRGGGFGGSAGFGGGGRGGRGADQEGLFGGSAGGGGEQSKMDVTASVMAAASGTQVGELFQYTVGSVSIDRQKSAMIPIVTDDVDVEKVSIYNAEVFRGHPLTGARVKNTTHKHLLAGPITVLDSSSYAGDARLDDVPPGQERLLSYGIDQQVLVDSPEPTEEQQITAIKTAGGFLTLTTKFINSRSYVIDNKADAEKVIIIENPRQGEWTLIAPPKADETTDKLYRFHVKVPAKNTMKLGVRFEYVADGRVLLTDVPDSDLAVYIKNAHLSQEVRDALAKLTAMRAVLADLEGHTKDRQTQVGTIETEQTRIRENMKTVSANTDYYNRLIKKLDEQETAIEALQKEMADLQAKAAAQLKQIQDYIAGLKVG
ncbi:MAG TPA: DUF4139 domain-containing protein [Humisphaera sp.]|jgi:hypothetical protein|nr:DUF4139 domain-containing protein [Humisphaera sp.]